VHNYLALIWNAGDSQTGARITRLQNQLVNARVPWQIAYSDTRALVMCHRELAPSFHIYPLPNHAGVILGNLFRRVSLDAPQSPDASIGPIDSQAICESRGRHLLEKYWGSYIAVVSQREFGRCALLRSPTGNLPCYHTLSDTVHVFFSDMEDVLPLLVAPLSIDWTHVAMRLLGGFEHSRDCGVREIEDVVGGEWIGFSGTPERPVPLWHPAQFCDRARFEDEREAAIALRATVLNVTRTLADQHTNIILRLSGGLDSSIIATCLAHQNERSRVTCLNFYIANDYGDEATKPLPPGLSAESIAALRRVIGSADERAFARVVANRCGFGLIERQKRARDIELQRIERAPRVPRPSHFVFMILEDEVESEVAAMTGASACFGGEAGDTVFYNTHRAIGALDYAYLHSWNLELVRQIRATSTLSRESYARVLWKIVKHSMLGLGLPDTYDLMGRPHLVTDEVARAMHRNCRPRHPWAQIPQSLSPGKREHALSVTNYIAVYPHPLNADRIAPPVHPLAAQPVVELCLSIPTYVLLANGVSRGLARRAFRDLLPGEVIRRTTKGGTMGFLQDAVRYNLKYIRERLLDGILTREKLLDRVKLDSFLVLEQPFLTVNAMQILDYLACENWLDQMTAVT